MVNVGDTVRKACNHVKDAVRSIPGHLPFIGEKLEAPEKRNELKRKVGEFSSLDETLKLYEKNDTTGEVKKWRTEIRTIKKALHRKDKDVVSKIDSLYQNIDKIRGALAFCKKDVNKSLTPKEDKKDGSKFLSDEEKRKLRLEQDLRKEIPEFDAFVQYLKDTGFTEDAISYPHLRRFVLDFKNGKNNGVYDLGVADVKGLPVIHGQFQLAKDKDGNLTWKIHSEDIQRLDVFGRGLWRSMDITNDNKMVLHGVAGEELVLATKDNAVAKQEVLDTIQKVLLDTDKTTSEERAKDILTMLSKNDEIKLKSMANMTLKRLNWITPEIDLTGFKAENCVFHECIWHIKGTNTTLMNCRFNGGSIVGSKDPKNPCKGFCLINGKGDGLEMSGIFEDSLLVFAKGHGHRIDFQHLAKPIPFLSANMRVPGQGSANRIPSRFDRVKSMLSLKRDPKLSEVINSARSLNAIKKDCYEALNKISQLPPKKLAKLIQKEYNGMILPGNLDKFFEGWPGNFQEAMKEACVPYEGGLMVGDHLLKGLAKDPRYAGVEKAGKGLTRIRNRYNPKKYIDVRIGKPQGRGKPAWYDEI